MFASNTKQGGSVMIIRPPDCLLAEGVGLARAAWWGHLVAFFLTIAILWSCNQTFFMGIWQAHLLSLHPQRLQTEIMKGLSFHPVTTTLLFG